MSLSTISPASARRRRPCPLGFCRPNERLAFASGGSTTPPRCRGCATRSRSSTSGRDSAGVRLARPLPIGSASPHPALVLVWCLPDDLPIVQAAPRPGPDHRALRDRRLAGARSSTTASGTTGRASPPRHGRVERRGGARLAPAAVGRRGHGRPAAERDPAPEASRRSISLITHGRRAEVRVAAALRQAGQIERAEIWGARDRREPVFQRPGH